MSADGPADAKPATRIAENWPRAIELPAGQHRLCGCRNSHRWPACDGQRPDCPTAAQTLTLPRSRFLWLCQCGLSRRLPFCDGDGHIEAARRAGSR